MDECTAMPCSNGGSCTNSFGGFSCKCVEGFMGKTCGSNVDECLNSECKNGGICEDGVNGYICNCKSGYDGDFCENS